MPVLSFLSNNLDNVFLQLFHAVVRAIEASLHDTGASALKTVPSSDSDLIDISDGNSASENSRSDSGDDQLRLAMAISQREADGVEARRKQEEEELERIIQLSLTDK